MRNFILVLLLFVFPADQIWAQTTFSNPSSPTATAQLIGVGSAPTIAAGSGAGTGPTVSITGTNLAGVITVGTGTATTGSATLATITFNGTLAAAPQGCTLMARNASSDLLATDIYTTAPTTTSWTIAVGATAPAISTSDVWSYSCF